MTADAPISPDRIHPDAAASRMWALVPCAGSGSRAATSVPKQYQKVAGRALIWHTLEAFLTVARVRHTLVVVAPEDLFFEANTALPAGRWRSARCGGETRARSVGNGLARLRALGADSEDWVLVHDAARCLITPEWINRLIDACDGDDVGGLLAHPVPDTLKLASDGRVVGTPDRTHQWLAQTPQMFRLGMLQRALQAAGDRVTDESSAIEALGLSPKLVRGSALNFKVTYPEDFALAHALLTSRHRLCNQNGVDYDYP